MILARAAFTMTKSAAGLLLRAAFAAAKACAPLFGSRRPVKSLGMVTPHILSLLNAHPYKG